MKNWILMTQFMLALAFPTMSKTRDLYLIVSMGSLEQLQDAKSQDAQKTDEFIIRLKDGRFKDIQEGSIWTLIHDYKDYKH